MNLIKIEVENIREKMIQIFHARNEEIQKMVERSLERYCTEEWLQNIVDQQVKECLERAATTKVNGSYEASDMITKIIHKLLLEKLKGISDEISISDN